MLNAGRLRTRSPAANPDRPLGRAPAATLPQRARLNRGLLRADVPGGNHLPKHHPKTRQLHGEAVKSRLRLDPLVRSAVLDVTAPTIDRLMPPVREASGRGLFDGDGELVPDQAERAGADF